MRNGGAPVATAVPSAGEISVLARKMAGLAFLTYLIFLVVVLVLSARSETPLYLKPDSQTYIAPAENLVRHGAFSRERVEPYLWEPYRTPGYPLLIAAFIAVTGRPSAVLFCAPLLASLLAYVLVRLTWDLFVDLRAARFAGMAVGFFPNGLGLSAMVLTDFLHGCVFVFAFWATYRAIRDRNVLAAASAAAFWVMAQLVRPTLSVAFILIGAFGLWLARDRRQIAITAAVILLSLPAPLYMSMRNFQAHGLFTPSLLGEVAVSEYVIPHGEALATGQDLERLQKQAHLQDRQAAEHSEGNSDIYRRLYDAERQRAAKTLNKYRSYVALGLALEAVRQTLAPWDWIVLALFGTTVPMARVICGIVYLGFIALSLRGSFLARQRLGFGLPVMLWFVFFFWIATGTASSFAGARYRFPGDLALIPLAALGATGVSAVGRRFRPGSMIHRPVPITDGPGGVNRFS